MVCDNIEKRMKKLALERDNFTCQICGSKGKMEVHHICPKRKSKKLSNHKLSNLITLCKSHHFKVHNSRKYGIWINYFRRLVSLKKPLRDLNFYMNIK